MDPAAADAADLAFAPPGEAWQRVSPRLATARRLVLAGTCGLVAVLSLAAAAVAGRTWLVGPAVAALAALAWGWGLIGRQVAAYGYAEREDDLLITSGIMWRRLVVVPYGRMQFVDVTAGPVERQLGVATVQLHTAAPATSASVPGLPPVEAHRLRDRLTALGEARAAGL